PVSIYTDPRQEPQDLRRKTLAHVMSSIVEELDSLEKKETKTPEQRLPPPVEKIASGTPPQSKTHTAGAHPSVVSIYCY
ncbi:hypothetical protein SK128_016113, partial [Halocaridina rubra]